MEALKSVVGLGTKQETSQEPVSGVKGEGTTAEPYDAGNDPVATETADKTEDSQEVEPGQNDGIAATKIDPIGATTTSAAGAPVFADDSKPSISSAAGKQPERVSSIGSGSGVGVGRTTADRSNSGGPSSPLMGSRGEGRGSMVPADAPRYKRVENPDRIPTAGGKRIGEEQYQTRRASLAPSSSPPPDMKTLDREGSPDAVTAGNTVSNTVPASAKGTETGAVASAPAPAAVEADTAPSTTAPAAQPSTEDLTTAPAAQPVLESAPSSAPHVEGKNTAPQQMKEFSMGEASREAETKPLGVGETEDVAPDEGSPSGNRAASGVAAGGEKEKKTEESGSGAKHGRRGSVFDKLKDKLKGHKK